MPDFIIPSELIDHLKHGDCVLFVGDALDEVGLQSARLAAALVDACGAHCQFCKSHGTCQCPASCEVPLTRAAQLYEGQHNRHSLIEFVVSQLDQAAVPSTLHRALATLPVRVMITTAYDGRLETALKAQGRAVLPVVRDTDVPFDDLQRTQLIYLHGRFDQPDSLVLTEDDAADLWTRLPNVARILGGHFASKTLLFVGYGLSDPNFLALYRQVTGPIQRTQRLAYAVQWPPDPLLADRWRGKITLLAAEPLAFVNRLTQGLQIKAVEVKRASLPPEPYKFLDYFTRADAEIFFGRDLEADLLLSRILAYPLTVFYGRSGVGKTSLLLARVGPRLDAEGYRVVYARMLGDPASEVKAAMRGVPIGSLNPLDRASRLIDVIVDALPPGGRVVIVLDQFEEFFLRQGEAVRQAFARELADCLKPIASIDVRLVLSLRDDYLGALDELSTALPQDVFARRYRLDNLTREKALVAILKPAEAFGLPIEEGLRERLIADLEDQGLETANLQIVLYRLYRDAVAQGRWQPQTRRGAGLTLPRYLALGETRQILAGYLDEVLNELPDEAQRQQARLILKSMVTPRQTKLAVSGQEIARGDLVGQARLTEAQVTAQLAYLREKRVVRKFGEEDRYELAHEVLVDKVWAWISDDELRQLEVRDMLRRELSNYQKFRHLLTPEKLALINTGGDGWTLTSEELELIFRSALASGDASTPDWFTRAKESGLPVETMAQEGLKSDNFRVRAVAVKAVAKLGAQLVDQIIEMLNDLYPQVRVAAIHALEKLQPTGEWRAHLRYECYVPAGAFIMGDDKSHRENERPAHEVNVAAFYIGKYPVTNADYKRYMDDAQQPWEIPAGKAEHPVVNVSWYQSRNYARWASLRLLTEAEWEKAASWDEFDSSATWSLRLALRGRTWEKAASWDEFDRMMRRHDDKMEHGWKQEYPWGDEFDKNRCNTGEAGIGTTTLVGKYSPQGDSPFGCADMVGNVREWTSSLKRAYPYRADDGREDQTSSNHRVQRGGSFSDVASNARCAFRYFHSPSIGWTTYGFRCGAGAAPEE